MLLCEVALAVSRSAGQSPDSIKMIKVVGTLPLGHLLVDDDIEGRGRYRAADRVAAKGAPVLAGLDHQQDLAVCQNDAHRIHAARDRLAQYLQWGERRTLLYG